MSRFSILIALLLVLNGCATTPDRQPVTDKSHELWSQRQQQLSALHNWEIRGRVALFVDNDVYNLGLNWVLAENHSILKLEAALGQGVIQLEKSNSEVTLTTSKGESFFGKNAEQVLFQSTGWSIPVEGLESWIKGINHNQSNYIPDIDSKGRALSLTQDDWKINYLTYEPAATEEDRITPELPQKIYMKRQSLALKIVIDQWHAERNIPTSDIFPVFKD